MNELDLQRRRIERLRAAIDKVTGGNVTAFGKRLGYKDGAYIRQMLSGVRPIREKTVFAVEELPGLRGFFGTRGNVVTTGGDGTHLVIDGDPTEAQKCRFEFSVALERCELKGLLSTEAVELIRTVVRASVGNVAPSQFAAVRQILDGLTTAQKVKPAANPSIANEEPVAELPSDQDVDDAISSALPGAKSEAAGHERTRGREHKRKSG
jgi:hypothetical protein